jgi:SSS family solute:Na+ symporter
MSGMAGNVTAFNTVFTYDLYQSYVRPNASDDHYLTVARWTTLGGVALSIAAAYLAQRYNNIMDVLQLVFSFVNAPLFATFLLGMFWKRSTGHGAFAGLLSGTGAAAFVHGLTIAEGKGGWIAAVHRFPSTMAQNLWMAIFAWSTCFAVTLLVSLATRPRPEDELRGLVYSLTPHVVDSHEPWYRRPAMLAIIVGVCVVVLNLIYW